MDLEVVEGGCAAISGLTWHCIGPVARLCNHSDKRCNVTENLLTISSFLKSQICLCLSINVCKAGEQSHVP